MKQLLAPSVADVVAWLHQVAPDAELCADSRQVEAGDVFVAHPGDGADGRQFIRHALSRGAAAVVFDEAGFNWSENASFPHRAVVSLQHVAGLIANGFYRQPDAGMFVAAVTGTNGKTSCSQWLGAALSTLGDVVGVVGTLGIGVYRRGQCDQFQLTGYTTPDAVRLQRELAAMRGAGVTALAIEASSIGLVQGRLNGLHVDAALLTNLTRDHLDYHHDMAAYEAAKNILFDWPGLRHAVLNLDDGMGQRLAQRLGVQSKSDAIAPALTGYQVTSGAEVAPPVACMLQADAIRSNLRGTQFRLQGPFGSSLVKTQLVGQFNVSNVLGVLGVLLARGVDARSAIAALEALVPVPGRMQKIQQSDAPLVIIDYAHTPDALAKALAALRVVSDSRHGELWCVFGCGGDRDSGKRPQMGAAAQAADHVVCTSDNPRTESATAIIADILRGMVPSHAGSQPQVIEDRATAILWAIRHAGSNDVVLVAGKGHEAYQEIGSQKLPFLDADHAALALSQRATMKERN